MMDIEEELRKIAARAKAMMSEHGWMVQHVLPEEGEPGYAYTVGLSENFGHPEIYIVGFPIDLTHALLNDLAERVKDGDRFDRPCVDDRTLEAHDVAFRSLAQYSIDSHSGIGKALLGGPFEAMQMFIPDPDGFFPWDRDCDPAYASFQTAAFDAVGPLPGSPEARKGLS